MASQRDKAVKLLDEDGLAALLSRADAEATQSFIEDFFFGETPGDSDDECRHNDVLYNEGDQIQPNCSTRCTCRSGNFQCEPQLCNINGASCYAAGDPHYHTFDRRYFDFQGACEYVLTKSCDSEEFSVTVSNGAHNPYVSCTDSVRILIPNENLDILLGRGRGGTVSINDVLQSNNGDEVILRSGQVEVVRVGGRLYVTLSRSGVRVSWDGSYRVGVTVSTSWRRRLCGLCGNYNNNPIDDFQTPDGTVVSSPNEFGISWALNNDAQDSCGGLVNPNPCPSALMSEALLRCSLLEVEEFSACSDYVNPITFINSCIYDYCYSNEADREHFYYSSLETYAEVCAETGVVISDGWRNRSECPPGMVYQQCGSLCPRTCDDTETPNCQSGCAGGCFCPDGQVVYNGRCVHPIVCPVCTHMGVQYHENDIIQPNCGTRCICRNGFFECEPQLCITDGATCQAYGDPHYRTFDSRYFDFQGNCEYILTQSCNAMEFAVIVTNSAHNERVSCTESVRVVIPNEYVDITFGRGGSVTINDVPRPNNGDEIILQSGQVEVLRAGGLPHVILRTSGVRVSWDGLYHVDVTVSTRWRGNLCGLCGDYNGDPNDDFQMPNNLLATNTNEFGTSWQLVSNISRVCIPPDTAPCPAELSAEAQSRCAILRGDAFSACSSVVDPQPFIANCEFDYCNCNDDNREECYCNSLAAYARACAANGVVVQNWRNNICSVECPPGMIYQQCGLLCPQTCDDDGASDCIAGCAEGCFCPVGQVVYNGECIVPIACPTCTFNGISYEEGYQIQPNCSATCTCRNGTFECESQACIDDGPVATCYAYGDPHYRTFDGHYFSFQGTCEYVLTSSCNSAEFAVTVTNGAHNEYVSCTDSVRVLVPGESLDILLGRGDGGTVTINDRVQPNIGDEVILQSGQVQVLRIGGRLHVVLGQSGVRITWDGLYRVEVSVSTGWMGRVCGLCGNYNNNPADDFLTPFNRLAASADEFGLSWIMNNDSSCGALDTPGPCPTNVMTEAERRCNVLTTEEFNICNNMVNVTTFVDSCMYDYCYSSDIIREEIYQSSIATYSRVCARAGVVIPELRNITECPSGMTYQQCGSLCVRTCDNPETSGCPSGCAEGCFCPGGLIVHDGRCIDPVACPTTSCTYMGIEYEEGVKIQPNCSTKCTCYRGNFQCEEQDCTIEQGASCHVYGSLHFQTFDRSNYAFQGRCEYVFMQPCGLANFSITIVTSSVPNENIFNIEMIKVTVTNDNENTTVSLGRGAGGTIAINGNLRPNNGDEVLYQLNELEVVRVGGHPHVLLIADSIDLYWDGQYQLSVTASQTWRGQLCGLCGNYNNDSNDDFQTRSGDVATTVNEFVSSWQNSDNVVGNCQTDVNPVNCPRAIASEAKTKCDELLGNNFIACSRVVNPFSFIDACFDDYCLSNEDNRQALYCSSLLTYTASCAAHSIILSTWRDYNCSVCPEGLAYQQCGSLCPQTCTTRLVRETCASGCVEGCFCPDGQVYINGSCRHPVSCESPMVDLNVTVEYERLKIEDDDTSSTLSCTTTSVHTIEVTNASITIFEGQPIHLECYPQPILAQIRWTFNNNDLTDGDNDRISLQPDELHHQLFINHSVVADSGIYICYVDTDVGHLTFINTTLTVIPVCQDSYSEGLFWRTQSAGQPARLRCSEFHPSFRSGVYISRMCGSDGQWGEIDFTNCTMDLNSSPFIHIEFQLSAYNFTDSLVNMIRDRAVNLLNEYDYIIIQEIIEEFTENGVIDIEMSFDVEQNVLQQSIIDAIPQDFITQFDYITVSVTGFQPSNNCSCKAPIHKNTINYLCIGPSLPVCSCVNDNCMCTFPAFAGNGDKCGLDSDGDKYPDVQLDCSARFCSKDVCPNSYSTLDNDEQDDTLCQSQISVSQGCMAGVDAVQRIWWPDTARNTIAQQKCPGGANSVGFAYRTCLEDATWDITINLSECHTIEYMLLNQQVNEAFNILTAGVTDTVETFNITEIDNIALDLSHLTSPSELTLSNDFNDAVDIIGTVVDVLGISNCLPQTTDDDTEPVFEKLATIVSNLLDSSKIDSFMANQDPTVQDVTNAEKLLNSIEKFSDSIADVFSDELISSKKFEMKRDNFNISIQMPVKEEIANVDGITFPEDGKTQIFIPSEVLLDEMNKGLQPVATFFIAKNLGNLLPNRNPSIDGDVSSMIISGKISSSMPTMLPEDKQIQLKFELDKDDKGPMKVDPKCAYWKFDSNNKEGKGDWSGDGIKLHEEKSDQVICFSDHLTSFVAFAKEPEPPTAEENLHFAIYIGCGIAVLLLLITVVMLIVWRKIVFDYKINWIHLHFAIVLILALIVFLAGIQTATSSKNVCTAVGVILHYLFLVAISWLLCECILIFILIQGSRKGGIFLSVYFYAVIAWCLPIPIVVISAALAHEHYGTNKMCWISDEVGLLWSFIITLIAFVLFSFLFLFLAICQYCKLNRNEIEVNEIKSNRNILIGLMIILLLMCGTLILGVFALNSDAEVFSWIFALLMVILGVIILSFFVLWNRKIRNAILFERHGKQVSKNEQTQREYAKTTYSNFTFGKKQYFRDARDKMSQNVFKNPNQIAGSEETAFSNQEDQDSLYDINIDGHEEGFVNEAFDDDQDIEWQYPIINNNAKGMNTLEMDDDRNATDTLF